jgi:hypothetical protein
MPPIPDDLSADEKQSEDRYGDSAAGDYPCCFRSAVAATRAFPALKESNGIPEGGGM